MDCNYGKEFDLVLDFCPLCKRLGELVSADCIRKGSFSRSTGGHNDKSYSDLLRILRNSLEERFQLAERIRQRVAVREAIAAKECEIDELRKHLYLLKKAISEAQQKKSERERYYAQQCDALKKNTEKFWAFSATLEEMRSSYSASLLKRQRQLETLTSQRQLLKKERHEMVKTLTKYVFPIEQQAFGWDTVPSFHPDDGYVVVSLPEASRRSHRDNPCAYSVLQCNSYTSYKIIQSILPGNGDYSSGATSVAQLTSSSEMEEQSPADNPKYAILSGLCHTTQLTQVLSHILNVFLPRKLDLSTFVFDDFQLKELMQVVSRLNHNVLHLCFSQGVDPSQLVSSFTFHNLLLLQQSKYLGGEHAFLEMPTLIGGANKGWEMACDSDDEVDIGSDWNMVTRTQEPSPAL